MTDNYNMACVASKDLRVNTRHDIAYVCMHQAISAFSQCRLNTFYIKFKLSSPTEVGNSVARLGGVPGQGGEDERPADKIIKITQDKKKLN